MSASSLRAVSVVPAGTYDERRVVDRVALAHDERHRRRIAMRAVGGMEFLLDLAEATTLQDGDGLVLEDGHIVRVVAAPEPLIEITGDAHLLVRVAWHLGNRHLPTQILAHALRIRADHVIEEMVRGLGATVAHIEAPFDPEGGAYGNAAVHGHDHPPHHGHHHHHHGRDQ